MKFSEPMIFPTRVDQVSFVASYHCLKKVKGSPGSLKSASNLARASSIISVHCVISPSGSPPISAAFRQASAAVSHQRFHNSWGLPALLANCSWASAIPLNHVWYRLSGSAGLLPFHLRTLTTPSKRHRTIVPTPPLDRRVRDSLCPQPLFCSLLFSSPERPVPV